MPPTVQILGIPFLDGTANEAVRLVCDRGGVLVVPAAPALVRLRRDAIYRQAMTSADAAIPDSGLMVLVWTIVGGRKLRRVSGLAYMQSLINDPAFGRANKTLFVLPSEISRTKLLGWSEATGRQIMADDCYVAPHYDLAVEDEALLRLVRARMPRHIVIAIGNGPQEKLGVYLRDHVTFRPAIHCIGAALGFLTGDQVAIPGWADRFYLGWLLRLFAQPRVFVPRLTRAAILPWLLVRYRRQMPPLARSAREREVESRI